MGLELQEREAYRQREHNYCDDAVEHLPEDWLGHEPGCRLGAVTDSEEPDHTGKHGTEREIPPVISEGVADSANENHGV